MRKYVRAIQSQMRYHGREESKFEAVSCLQQLREGYSWLWCLLH